MTLCSSGKKSGLWVKVFESPLKSVELDLIKPLQRILDTRQLQRCIPSVMFILHWKISSEVLSTKYREIHFRLLDNNWSAGANPQFDRPVGWIWFLQLKCNQWNLLLQSHLYTCFGNGMQITLTDFRMDVPRHSYSPELYSFSCGHATFIFPAAYAYLQRLHAEVGRQVPFLILSERRRLRGKPGCWHFTTIAGKKGCQKTTLLHPLLRTPGFHTRVMHTKGRIKYLWTENLSPET